VSRRSSRSRGSNWRLLLDTSFLLPILGFKTVDAVMRTFEKLNLYTLYYSEISVLEASWKIVKVIKEEEATRVAEGLRAIRVTMNRASIDEEALKHAVRMYSLGHRDMVDNLLYSIAVTKELKLLTVDTELLRFVEKHELPREYIVVPDDLP